MTIGILGLADCGTDTDREFERNYNPLNNDPEPDLDLHSPHLDELIDSARKHIRDFFKGKSLFCGGPVSVKAVSGDFFVAQVLNTKLLDGIDAVYGAWPTAVTKRFGAKEARSAAKEGKVPEDVAAVLGILHELERLHVPKAFRGGLMMMHFEFCEGLCYDADLAEAA